MTPSATQSRCATKSPHIYGKEQALREGGVHKSAAHLKMASLLASIGVHGNNRSHLPMLKFITLASFVLLSSGQAMSSSDNAWEEFSAEVEKGCIDASSELFTEASAVVDPFGTESYGLAVVTGQVQSGQTASAICVFNKQTKAVELGGELNVMVTSR